MGVKKGRRVLRNYHSDGMLSDASAALAAVVTDFELRCPTLQLAVAHARAGLQAYVYRFDHSPSLDAVADMFGFPAACQNRTCHSAEMPFLFHNLPGGFSNVTPAESLLAQ